MRDEKERSADPSVVLALVVVVLLDRDVIRLAFDDDERSVFFRLILLRPPDDEVRARRPTHGRSAPSPPPSGRGRIRTRCTGSAGIADVQPPPGVSTSHLPRTWLQIRPFLSFLLIFEALMCVLAPQRQPAAASVASAARNRKRPAPPSATSSTRAFSH